MHIAHVQGIFLVEHGGPTQSTASYCRGQVARGDRVSLFTLEGYRGISPAVRLAPPVEMHVHPVGFPDKLGRSGPLKQDLLSAEPADIYHLHGVWLRACYYGALKARQSGRPFLIEMCGAFEPYAIKQKPMRKVIARKWFQDRMIHEAGCIHLNSQKEAEFLRSEGFKSPFVVLPVGVDTVSIASAVSTLSGTPSPWPQLAGRPFILFLSRVHKNKGIEPLLGAWAKIAAKHSDWILAVAGPASPEYGEQLKQSAATAGIGERVTFLGKVTDEQRSWAYSNCGLYVLPSFSENFGNTVAEAMAHGRATIATPNTPWGELPAEGAGWIAEPTPESLAGKIDEALGTSDSFREQMGVKGRALVERKYSLQFVVERLDQTYRWLRHRDARPDFVSV